MNLFRAFLILLLLSPISAVAQGVRMSADFFPLSVGNKWTYELTNEDGVKIGDIDMAVQEYTIVDGRSFYVFSAFPFVAPDEDAVRLIRYDRQEREFLRISRDEEGP